MRAPVVAIGIDAAEIEVIDRLMAAGRLPHLAALRATGSEALLTHRHGGLQSSIWCSFITGQLVTGHGCYFPKAWRADRMRIEFINDEWPPIHPFWEGAGPRQPRLALIDIPYLPPPNGSFDGLFLGGWQCHDVMPRRSVPAKLLDEIEAKFGTPELGPEQYGPQTVESLERTHGETLRAARQIGEICASILQRDNFDLFAVVLGSAHRAGHYLWDLSQVDAQAMAAERRQRLERALDEVYEACDASIGRIVAAAPPGARILVFALHGMGPNLAWYEQLGTLIELASETGDAPGRPRGIWGLGAAMLQSPAAKAVTTRIPGWLQHRLTPLWTKRMRDWSRTPFFTLPSDLHGYIRLNQRGREPEGIVPLEQARAVLQRLGDGFMALVDIGTGRPVCEKVQLIDDIDGPDAPMRAALPDMVVHWADRPLSLSTGVRNGQGQERRWPRVTRYRSGRSGNHRPNGWMIAAGPGIPHGERLGELHAIDLAPTLCGWLGMTAPSPLDGRPVEALAGQPSLV
jgi:predicted AlkP superfamily phosphohydrolase/phosphomutase